MERFLLKNKIPPQEPTAAVPELDTTSNNRDGNVLESTSKQSDNLKLHQKQKFREKWALDFEWIIEKYNTAFCKYCQLKLPNNKCHLIRHELSQNHKKRRVAVKNQPKLEAITTEFQSEINKIKTAELLIIMFIVQNNLPFLLIQPLIELIKNVATDSTIAKKVNLGKTKATETVQKIFLNESNNNIAARLKTQKFSMIIDETTDISSSKCLAIVVRYFNSSKGKVRDRFLALLNIQKFDAMSIFEAIQHLFSKLEIPLKNCIGFASDNASVMTGKNNSVKALLLKEIPHIFTMGCMCHSIHLCSSAASKMLPNNAESLVRNIYFYFSHSAKRQSEYKEFQEAFNVQPHKILKTSKTRWLSLEQVVARVIEQWTPLQYFFLNAKYCSANSDLALNIQNELNDHNKFYLLFLNYVLKLTTMLNLEFQAETVKIHVLLPHVKAFYKTILSNFIKKEFCTFDVDFENNDCFKDHNEIYCGPKAELFLNSENFSEHEQIECKKICKTYYITLCKEIAKRINFNDPVLKAISGINPSSLIQSLVPIASAFPNIISENDIEELDYEWRLLINSDFISKDLEFEEYWSAVFKMKNAANDAMFPFITKCLPNLFCLPHSSATAERIFSQLFLIKDKKRNCLSVETVNAIMATKELLADSEQTWKPSKSILNAYRS